jgi:hypothetical protein
MSVDFQFFVDARTGWASSDSSGSGFHGARLHRESMTRHKELQFREAWRCLRILYERYRRDRTSPINLSLYRRAMAYQLRMEARFYGRIRGVRLLAARCSSIRATRNSWLTVEEFWGRLRRRASRAAPSGRHG